MRLRIDVLALLALASMAPLYGTQADDVTEVEVVASRYAFKPATIEVPRGHTVRLVARSADVTHGLEIEAFDVKEELPKGGEPVTIEFVAAKAGKFKMTCSEYCGSGHERMNGTLVVLEEAAK